MPTPGFPKVKVGDYVRVVLEGKVVKHYDNEISIKRDDSACNNLISINPDQSNAVSIEIINPPEREWQRGDVVKAANGCIYLRTYDQHWTNFQGVTVVHDTPVRPLALYVPEKS